MVEKPTEPTGRSPVARSVPLAEGIRYAPALSAGNAHSKGKVQIGRRHAVGMCPRERRRRANRVDEQAIWSTRGTEQEWPYTGGRAGQRAEGRGQEGKGREGQGRGAEETRGEERRAERRTTEGEGGGEGRGRGQEGRGLGTRRRRREAAGGESRVHECVRGRRGGGASPRTAEQQRRRSRRRRKKQKQKSQQLLWRNPGV
ncbi:hypothetical protein AXG93_1923s1810 [Marchantia polymorpha subsp. ruderalis]|uniref:Uncharacterized protein n=1 Tax=Marchantia polymorpha subsp. ruderalis TaxID=1480154 RepID=A0A176VCN3_MARPO|nr:hypothetical protein AXG93_1923s1810 [Marchantia polymorpha subsp. ruderalis]